MRITIAALDKAHDRSAFRCGQPALDDWIAKRDEWRADIKVMDKVQAPGGALTTLARFRVTPDRSGVDAA